MSEPAAPEQQQKKLTFLVPAITGGLFLGVLATIPYINLGCCLWLLGGGAIAAFLVNKQNPGQLNLGDGALAGVSSGLVGTIVSTLISIPLQSAMYTPAAVAELRKTFAQWVKEYNLPPDFMQSMEPMLTPGFSLPRLIAFATSFSIFGGLLAMIGGILMVALLKRRTEKF